MRERAAIRWLFGVGALYDGVLGVGFLLAGGQLFEAAGITPPNHWGYVHFPALLLILFAAMFAAIAREPEKNRGLIAYGIGLKLAYAGTVFFHWMTGGIPWIWKPFAICDLIFAAAFAWAWVASGRGASVSSLERPSPDKL